MKIYTKILCFTTLMAFTAVANAGTGTSQSQSNVNSPSGTAGITSDNSGSSLRDGNGSGNNTLTLDNPVISGPLVSVCPGQVRTYTCTASPGATQYDWVAPVNAMIINGQGTTQVDVSFGPGFFQGYLRVTARNATDHSGQTVVTVYSAPTTPLPIQGPSTGACAGGTYTYSIPPVVSAVSYTWSAPAGAVITAPAANGNPLTTSVTSVDITFPAGFHDGVVSVRANSGCNSSIQRAKSVRSILQAPSPIEGLSKGLCDLPNIPYSVLPVAGASGYTWSIDPSTGTTIHNNGNNAITVDFDATFNSAWMTVTADNVCGHGDPRKKQLNAWPDKPILPVGPVGGCNNDPANSIAYYEIDPVFNTTYYRWFLPPGATMVAGQGTTNITVDYFGASSGVVKVWAENSCGHGPSIGKQVTVNNCRLGNGEQSVMQLSAYPSPAKDNLTVSFSSEASELYSIQMFDMTGRIVLNETNASHAGINKQELNLQNISTGLYNLVVSRGTVTERLRVVVE